jgi:acetoin utilization deacetylase AcuC-like enzyme
MTVLAFEFSGFKENRSMKVFYSDEYVSAEHAWDTTRKAARVAAILETEPAIRLTKPEPLQRFQLTRVHDESYVDAVLTGQPRSLAESNGFKWCPNLPSAVLYSNGGVVAATYEALNTGVSGSLSSGLHHAGIHRGGGFCTFNGLAIAAVDVITNNPGYRILIIDFDAHYGDGTAQIIKKHKAIDQIDVSTGYQKTDYLTACRQALDSVNISDYSVILYNAGMDPHEKCMIGGRSRVTDDILHQRDQMVFQTCRELRKPVAFVLAGGYANTSFPDEQLAQLHAETCRLAAASLNI